MHQLHGAASRLPMPFFEGRTSTDSVSRRERFDYWAAAHGGFADFALHQGVSADFEQHTENWLLGPLRLLAAHGSGLRFSRTRAHCERDGLDHWVVRLSLGSSWGGAIGGREFQVSAGVPMIMQMSQASLTVLPAGQWRVLVVTNSEENRDLSALLLRRGVGPVAGPLGGVLADVLAGLPDRLRCAAPSDIAPLSSMIRALLLACAHGAAPLEVAPSARQRILRLIEGNLGSARLDAARIGLLAGMSRSALYRLFGDDGGVARVVRDMRLRLILADLSDPERASEQIGVIAERRGMHCAASFSRAFRQAFGCTPSEARARALSGAPVAQDLGASMRAGRSRLQAPD